MNEIILPQYSCAMCGSATNKRPTRSRSGKLCERVYCNNDCYQAHRPILKRELYNQDVKCLGCGQVFSVSKKEIEKGYGKYCSLACMRFSKRQIAKNCVRCGCYFSPTKYSTDPKKIIPHAGGKTCSNECMIAWISENEERKLKISKAFSGDNHWNWKGGKVASYAKYRGPNWKEQRLKCLKRDGYKCVSCGITDDQHKEKFGSSLHINHIIPYHNINDFRIANKLNNLESLCACCHTKREDRSNCQLSLQIHSEPRMNRRKGYNSGENVHLSKLKNEDVRYIRSMHKKGMSTTEIHSRFYSHVGRSAIYDVITRKTWKHLP